MDENTLFDMASTTKIIATTSLALIALEKGLLNLDDSSLAKLGLKRQTKDNFRIKPKIEALQSDK